MLSRSIKATFKALSAHLHKYFNCKSLVGCFVRTFEYGADNDGYRNYNHMVLQLEDCVDVLQHLFPQYEYLFLFDHSSGHDKQREDGLNVKKMWNQTNKQSTNNNGMVQKVQSKKEFYRDHPKKHATPIP